MLADMSTQQDVQEAIINNGSAVQLLIRLLDSSVPTVHRCAAATLANVVEAPRGVGARALPQVFEANGVAAIQKLLLTSSTPQVLRECGKALSEMCMMGMHACTLNLNGEGGEGMHILIHRVKYLGAGNMQY